MPKFAMSNKKPISLLLLLSAFMGALSACSGAGNTSDVNNSPQARTPQSEHLESASGVCTNDSEVLKKAAESLESAADYSKSILNQKYDITPTEASPREIEIAAILSNITYACNRIAIATGAVNAFFEMANIRPRSEKYSDQTYLIELARDQLYVGCQMFANFHQIYSPTLSRDGSYYELLRRKEDLEKQADEVKNSMLDLLSKLKNNK